MNKQEARKAALDIVSGLIYGEALSPTDLSEEVCNSMEDHERLKVALFEIKQLLDRKRNPRPRKSAFAKALEYHSKHEATLARLNQLLKDTEDDESEDR